MKIQTNNNTGAVVLCPVAYPSPQSGFTLREVTPEIQAVINQGGPFLWVPTDPENPSGEGTLTKAAPAPLPLRDRLLTIVNAQPAVVKAAFAPVLAGVDWLLQQGDTEAAQAAVFAVEVPAELAPVKDALLAEF